MRLLIIIAILISMPIPGAFAQSSRPPDQRDRLAAAKRNLAEIERARLLDALRHSTLRMQAQSDELEKLNQQIEPPAPGRSITQQDVERQHPEWFREQKAYRPCPWNMCPPPQ